jgi:hypothetical protein
MDSASYFDAFTGANVLFTAVGAAVYWGLNGRSKLRAFVLRDLLDYFQMVEKTRSAVEFVVFVVLGCLVGIAVTNPSSAIQAITAGFGWTGLFARPNVK